MSLIKLTPMDISKEYSEGTTYLKKYDVFDIVKENEAFYEGRQWEGLEKDTKLPKPVLNVLQRAGKFMIATIGSNDIAISMTAFSELPDDQTRVNVIAKEIENIIEISKIKEQSKLIIRNAFVDGSAYLLASFDPSVDTGQKMKGAVKTQVIDNTNVIFGNPYSNDIQSQPYIIIALRQHISQVKYEAKKLGISKDDIELIQPDNDYSFANDDSDNLVTVLLKFYRDTHKEKKMVTEIDEIGQETIVEVEEEVETIWFTKTTPQVVLIQPTDLGYKRYPISCFGWDVIKNSYLYTSPMTSNISNQIFINKCLAIAQMYGMQSAFPKTVYDKNKIDIEEFMSSTSPFAVSGIDSMGKFMDFIKVPDFSNNIIELFSTTISQMKECMGVTEASLGNVNPDNTSAIIALQESSNVPLEIQKSNFYEFWEDTVRNLIDIVGLTYGVRQVMSGDTGLADVNFSALRSLNFNLKVEIGNGAQFSEIAQINTLDKLVQAGYITPDVYMEVVPSKYLPQKQKLINSYKEMISQGQMPQARGSVEMDETSPL